MEGMVYKEERDTLEPGDLLFLYTDGVTEAIDTEDHLFSEDRLKDLLTAKSTKDVQTAVDHTVAAVRTFEGEAEQTDDITVLALEYHGRLEDAAQPRSTRRPTAPILISSNRSSPSSNPLSAMSAQEPSMTSGGQSETRSMNSLRVRPESLIA
jgi:serine/threonine protein phosphatase PrpC